MIKHSFAFNIKFTGQIQKTVLKSKSSNNFKLLPIRLFCTDLLLRVWCSKYEPFFIEEHSAIRLSIDFSSGIVYSCANFFVPFSFECSQYNIAIPIPYTCFKWIIRFFICHVFFQTVFSWILLSFFIGNCPFSLQIFHLLCNFT